MSGLTNDLLYTTYRLRPFFRDQDGTTRELGWGTGFGLTWKGVFMIATARHLVDAAFADPECKGWQLEGFDINAKAHDPAGMPTRDLTTRIVKCRPFYPGDAVTDVAFVAQLSTEDGANLNLHPIDHRT